MITFALHFTGGAVQTLGHGNMPTGELVDLIEKWSRGGKIRSIAVRSDEQSSEEARRVQDYLQDVLADIEVTGHLKGIEARGYALDIYELAHFPRRARS